MTGPPIQLPEPLLEDPVDLLLVMPPLPKPLDVAQQDEVEDPLPLPEILLGQVDEGTQQPLERHQKPPGKAPVTANRERNVPIPEVAPILETMGRPLPKEVLDFRGPAVAAHRFTVRADGLFGRPVRHAHFAGDLSSPWRRSRCIRAAMHPA